MKPACDAISYSGAGGGTIGAFATNGGLTFSGSSNKKVDTLGYDKTTCTNLDSSPKQRSGRLHCGAIDGVREEPREPEHGRAISLARHSANGSGRGTSADCADLPDAMHTIELRLHRHPEGA